MERRKAECQNTKSESVKPWTVILEHQFQNDENLEHQTWNIESGMSIQVMHYWME